MAEKADDRFCTPLCHYHHQSSILAQHRIGEQIFWFEIHGRNPFDIAELLWIESGGAARALKPKPGKKSRKIKPRDHDAPKRQILGRPLQSRPTFQKGRKLQSRGFEKRPA